MKLKFISSLTVIFLNLFPLYGENESLSKNIYSSLIQPVFAAKCQECHGSNKSKGKLKLHTKKDFLKGGSSAGEDIVIKGNSADSELIFRITLPPDDDEAMPPMEDKNHYNPVTKQELDVIKAWISLGASFDLLVSDLEPASQENALQVFQNMPKKLVSKTAALQLKLPNVPKAKPEYLEKINKEGILAIPVAQNTNAIYVNASYVGNSFDDKHFQLLEPIAEQIIWLNLARTNISNKTISILPKFKLLSRLHLENTAITDEASIHLSKLSNLEYLNLYGTEISDDSISNLKKLINLDKIFLWQTKMTQKGAEKLKRHFVDGEVYDNLLNEKHFIQNSLSKLIKSEQLKIQKLEIIKNRFGAKSSDLEAINTKCPVTNKTIDISIRSIFEGRKLGFCCNKCKLKFDADGAVFRSKIKDFSASEKFVEANKNWQISQNSMDDKIEKIQQKLRIITKKLNSMGPEVNLGWEEPIVSN